MELSPTSGMSIYEIQKQLPGLSQRPTVSEPDPQRALNSLEAQTQPIFSCKSYDERRKCCPELCSSRETPSSLISLSPAPGVSYFRLSSSQESPVRSESYVSFTSSTCFFSCFRETAWNERIWDLFKRFPFQMKSKSWEGGWSPELEDKCRVLVTLLGRVSGHTWPSCLFAVTRYCSRAFPCECVCSCAEEPQAHLQLVCIHSCRQDMTTVNQSISYSLITFGQFQWRMGMGDASSPWGLFPIIPSHMVWSRSVVSNSLGPHGLQPPRLLHPWDFPGKNTVVGCHFLLQEIFPTQRLNPGLPHCRQTLYCLSHQGSLKHICKFFCDPVALLKCKKAQLGESLGPAVILLKWGLWRSAN